MSPILRFAGTGWLLALLLFLPARAQENLTPVLEDVSAPAPALDLSRPIQLSLPQALERGLSSHPNVLAAQRRMRSAYWTWEKAGSLPSGQLTAGAMAGTNVPGSQPGGSNPTGAGAGFATFAANGQTDAYLQLTQPFLPFGAQSASQSVAQEEYALSRNLWKQSRIELSQQIRDAFYALLAAQATLDASRENLALARESHQIAGYRLDAGAGPKLDLIDAGILLSRAQQDLVRAKSNLRQAQTALSTTLALPACELQATGQLSLPEQTVDLERMRGEADLGPRPGAARAALRRAEAAVVLAECQSHPNPTFSFVRDLTTHTYQVQVGLQFPLDWGQIENEVLSKQEGVQEQSQILQSTRLSLSGTLSSTAAQYQAAVSNAAEFREKILLPSEQSTRITQYGFKRGAVPYLRLLTSQQNLIAVRKEYIALLQSAWIALHALEASAGRE